MGAKRDSGTGFTLILLVFSAAVFVMSIQMFAKTSFDLSGYGGIPVMMSFLMVLFLATALLEDLKGTKDNTTGVGGLLTKDTVIFLALVIAYCAALGLGIPFLLSTPIFLLASMQYLMGGFLKGNIIYTALVTIGVYVIFVMIFHVSLP